MPRFHKLSKTEIRALEAPQARPELAKYVEFVTKLKSGDWVRVTLAPREKPRVVKRRLTTASKTLGKTLRYYPSPKATEILFSVQGRAGRKLRRRRRTRRRAQAAPAARKAPAGTTAKKPTSKVTAPSKPAKEAAE